VLWSKTPSCFVLYECYFGTGVLGTLVVSAVRRIILTQLIVITPTPFDCSYSCFLLIGTIKIQQT
jgi:predicted membrane channel-forming protein YqfA (hemolysin III family)